LGNKRGKERRKEVKMGGGGGRKKNQLTPKKSFESIFYPHTHTL
jgi:hypothetical protein